ncbi:MAG: polar amino acid transport system substrate-binding protein [Paraglaciecola sp.]|jgi:polar amino acid transport system substrate-binding protein
MLAVVLLFFLSIGGAQASTEITMGVILFPPDVIIDEKTKECVGINIAITREILLKYDIKVNVICASPLRIYRMIEVGEIDFTINIKSTKALTQYVVFSDIPFRKIILNLYTHNEPNQSKTISTVRGFDYQGYRQRYSDEGFEFIDLPNTISAIQVFMKGRSRYMLSYESPVKHYMGITHLSMKNTVSIIPLLEIDSYYGVAKRSPHRHELMQALSDYGEKHQARNFLSAWQQENLVK